MTNKWLSHKIEYNIKTLNAATWPYFIISENGNFNEPLNSLDLIRLYLLKRKLLKGQNDNESKLFLPSMRIEVDLNSMDAKLEGLINKKFKLVRSDNGVR